MCRAPACLIGIVVERDERDGSSGRIALAGELDQRPRTNTNADADTNPDAHSRTRRTQRGARCSRAGGAPI